MPFGEYELSPGLIGLSLLHSPHPEAFQRLLVRTSIPCYRNFILDKCRSPGFASAAINSSALFRLASATAPGLMALGLADDDNSQVHYAKGTPSQHKLLRPLVGVRFQELFHSPARGAFHLSFTVLVHYRSLTSI